MEFKIEPEFKSPISHTSTDNN